MTAALPPGGEREGAILAARWSIERLRRPAAAELVWLGYAKPEVLTFDCLACGEPGFKQGVVRALGRTLYLCPACASHQVHPPSLAAAPPQGLARRQMLESGLDFADAAASAARAMGGVAQGRLLDLACGLGLVVDMVGAQPGWEAVGFDAGPLPALGAEVLGAPLAAADPASLRAALQAAEPTVVLCEGAIERSDDPLALLRLLGDLAGGARWLLATADAAALYTLEDGAAIRALVEPRVLLPSRPGLQRLLARAGLPDRAIVADGTILHAVPDAAPPPAAAEAVLDAWFERRGHAPFPDASARLGLQLAALERATQRAEWGAARRLLATLAPALAASGEAARIAEPASMEALFAKAPTGASRLLLAAGFVHLHGGGASTQALMCFELAAQLAARVQAWAPGALPAEAERGAAARFHAALTARALGDAARAEAGFRAVAEDGRTPPDWAARARAELAAPEARPRRARRAAR